MLARQLRNQLLPLLLPCPRKFPQKEVPVLSPCTMDPGMGQEKQRHCHIGNSLLSPRHDHLARRLVQKGMTLPEATHYGSQQTDS
jgi:hypothetical protein